MNGSFVEIHSLKEIQSYLASPQETLIVFDIDYVLTQPIEKAFQFPNILKQIEFVKKLFHTLSPSEKDLMGNLMVMEEPGSCLIEKETPSFIEQLKSFGYKVIALTAGLTTRFDEKDFKKEKMELLKKLNLHFSAAFSQGGPSIYDCFEINFNSYPEFDHGILFCNGENREIKKGAVLKHFLKEVEFSPSVIVIIDDRDKNLESISNSLAQTPIEVKCFLYKGCLTFSPCETIEKRDFEMKWLKLVEKAKRLDQQFN